MILKACMYLLNIYVKIVEYDIDKTYQKKETQLLKLWNKSLLTLSILYLIISLWDFFWLSSEISYAFFMLSMLFFLTIFTDLKFNPLAQTFAYLYLSFVYFYISSLTGIQSGVFLFYIPLILSVPNFLSIKTNKWNIALIYFFCFLQFFLAFKMKSIEHPYSEAIFMESLFGTIGLTLWLVYFTIQKQLLNIKYYSKTKVIQFEEIEINSEKFEELVFLAKKGDYLFFTKFNTLYPHFTTKLLEIQPNVVVSELEFCAYIKLNFSTKEIAVATNSSVRSVEGKKYRIRKKYNIPEKIDVYFWMNNL